MKKATAKYFYDDKAAERPITLIEKWLYTADGKPFRLLTWQKEIIRKAYGWKHKKTGRRRYKTVYLAIGKGNGKSGLICALNLFHLIDAWCLTKNNQVVNLASSYGQIRDTVWEPLKAIIRASPRVNSILHIKEYSIDLKGTPSRARALTGKPKAGYRPSFIGVDELHQHANGKLIAEMRTAMGKRPKDDPIMWIATNAGEQRTGIAWEYHSKALDIISGKATDDTFLPVVYAAADNDDWRDEKVWIRCNPSIGELCSLEHFREEFAEAQKDPAKEAEFRRYYLTQFVRDTSYALDERHWSVAREKARPEFEKWPLVLHLDASKVDDFTALGMVWYDPADNGDHYHADCKLWAVQETVTNYQKRGVPYDKWISRKEITVFDSPTIDLNAKAEIAKTIVELCGKYNVQAVTYDRAYASEIISRVEKATIKDKGKVPCLPVPQNTVTITQPTIELRDRLKAGSLTVADNECLAWQAGNVQFKRDRWHNLYPEKPGADRYAGGQRHLKIGGVVAIISAIKEVLRRTISKLTDKEQLEQAAREWDGSIKTLRIKR